MTEKVTKNEIPNSIDGSIYFPVPTQPLNVSAVLVINTTSSLVVNWREPSEPNGVLLQYGVNYWPQGAPDSADHLTTAGNLTQVQINGLMPYTTYVIQVSYYTTNPIM